MLRMETGKEAIFLELDLANIVSTKMSASEFKRCIHFQCLKIWAVLRRSAAFSKESELHGLFNGG